MSRCLDMGNSYLRLVSSLSEEPNKVMTICTQSRQELQLALEAIQIFAVHMNYGKARKTCPMRISLSLDGTGKTRLLKLVVAAEVE